ncbi:MAG: hypothetical protein OXC01_14510 [Immundisolibacterales bacterium]|nr:hypothetical protein [Immundisolibacterales bacterium]
MIRATVRYRLPESIDRAACRDHFEKIAPGFREVPGLIGKHFICGDHGIAGGVYQRKTREDAEAFYSGPWRAEIVERYGMKRENEYFRVFCITDNAAGEVRVVEPAEEAEGA